MICNKCGMRFIRRADRVRFIDWCDSCNFKWEAVAEGLPYEGAKIESINVSNIFLQKQYKKVRHNVCEKIRKSFDEHRKILQSNYDECIFSMDDIIEELDEIERGEE